MTCRRCRALLTGLTAAEIREALDGRPGRVGEHLRGCPQCVLEARSHLRLSSIVRASAPHPEPPEGFWERAAGALDRSAQRPRRIRGRRALVGWAAGAILAAALWAAGHRPAATSLSDPTALYKQVTTTAVEPSVRTHDADFAATWISRRTGRAMPIVNLTLAGANLVEASIVRQPRAAMPVLRYETPEGDALLIQTEDGPRPPGTWSKHSDGRYRMEVLAASPKTATWTAPGGRYYLIYPGPLDRLIDIARTAARHCQVAPG